MKRLDPDLTGAPTSVTHTSYPGQEAPSPEYIYNNVTTEGNYLVPDRENNKLEAFESITLKRGTTISSGANFNVSINELGEQPGQFIYDAIGNLIEDKREGIKISWTPSGKIATVDKEGMSIYYEYDASGNRVKKTIDTGGKKADIYSYIRDASGNIMSIYKDNLVLSEQPIYGSSRLGIYNGKAESGTKEYGNRQYELTNHLGNVLATVSDKLTYDGADYVAEVLSWSDYYPFGMTKQERTNSNENYRYGFNGKEKDTWAAEGNIYDYGFRIYNPQYAKFLSVDPLTKSYPELTPYQFASNTPLWAIDLDGLEAKTVTSYQLFVKPKVGWVAKQLTRPTLVSNDGDWSGIKNVNQYFNYQGMIPENEKPSIKQVETLENRQSNAEAMVGAYKSNSRVREGVKTAGSYATMVASAPIAAGSASLIGASYTAKASIDVGTEALAQYIFNKGDVGNMDLIDIPAAALPNWLDRAVQSSSDYTLKGGLNSVFNGSKDYMNTIIEFGASSILGEKNTKIFGKYMNESVPKFIKWKSDLIMNVSGKEISKELKDN